MTPKIESGAEVTLEPIVDYESLKKGEVVLASIGRSVYLHLISSIDKNKVQISNNHGHVNGWTSKIFGRVVSVNNSPNSAKQD